MRLGYNPFKKNKLDWKPDEVTVAILVCIPNEDKYFQHRTDIVKTCLNSIIKFTKAPHELLIFDNGSTLRTRKMLQEYYNSGYIDTLYHSQENIGKINALRIISQMARGKYIAYSDDDILFYPDWLQKQKDLLENFPLAGMVSGVAIRNTFEHACETTAKLIGDGKVEVEYGRIIPEDWEVDFAINTGRNVSEYLQSTENKQDVLLKSGDIRAYATSNHFQFLITKKLLNKTLGSGWNRQMMGQMKELDIAIDHCGTARIATYERCVRHMGNVISSDLAKDLQDLGLDSEVELEPLEKEKSRNFYEKKLLEEFIKSRFVNLEHQFEKLVLYGAGKHSLWLSSLLKDIVKIDYIIDDKVQGNLNGIRIVQEVDDLNNTAIILSSDSPPTRALMLESSNSYQSCAIVDLYDSLPGGPYPKNIDKE